MSETFFEFPHVISPYLSKNRLEMDEICRIYVNNRDIAIKALY